MMFTNREKNKYIFQEILLSFLLFVVLALGGCGTSADANHSENEATPAEAATATSGDKANALADTEVKTVSTYYQKGNDFQPIADGTTVEKNDEVILDLSHMDQGYVMASYQGKQEKMVIQMVGPDGITYTYYLSSDKSFHALPLTAGDGNYQFTAYENLGEDQYVMSLDKTLAVTLQNQLLPFLYSNQYVNYNKKKKAVKLAKKLTKGKNQLEAVQTVYEYVTKHVTYDYEKAETVQSGYLPNVDETLNTGTGICFDYAALMTAMLRSVGIPTRLDIGYATDIYHAWISTYLDETGWVDNVIEFDGKDWTLMDPTFASQGSENIKDYITNNDNYQLEFVH